MPHSPTLCHTSPTLLYTPTLCHTRYIITTLIADNQHFSFITQDKSDKLSLILFKVSETLFWSRFLFRIHVAREEETKRQIIRKDAQIRAQSDIKSGNDLNWDDGDIKFFCFFCHKA